MLHRVTHQQLHQISPFQHLHLCRLGQKNQQLGQPLLLPNIRVQVSVAQAHYQASSQRGIRRRLFPWEFQFSKFYPHKSQIAGQGDPISCCFLSSTFRNVNAAFKVLDDAFELAQP